MRFHVLGSPEVIGDGGDELPLRPQTQRLLALLVIAAARPVTADRIGEVLGSSTDGSGVRMAVSRLRSAVGDRLETARSGYRLVPRDDDVVDGRAFDDAVRRSTRQGPAEQIETLHAALALWRGDAYGELAGEEWATAEATRLEQARLAAVEDLADAMLACSRSGEAALLLQSHLEALRYRERSAALLIEALASSGRTTEALRAYAHFRRTLIDDIGIEPSNDLRRMEADLLETGGVAPRRPVEPADWSQRLDSRLEPASSFHGRAAELANVVADMGDHRLVSLVGPGGVGKTRLAIEASRAVAPSVPDGRWFVDLAPVSDSEAVVYQAADALGVAGSGNDLPASIVDHLRGRRALVIVDNCEQVLLGAAAIVGAMVAECPDLRVLVTSREPLGLAGECVHPLAPLGADDAVDLFGVRAREANRSVAFDADDLAVIERICERVDGMPLSIELAAARVRTTTPSEILERLDSVLGDPSRGHGRPERHRTTGSVVAWSHGLLSDSQRVLFDRLSVFAGGFDLGAAAAVCEFDPIVPGGTPALLDALVDKSMVMAEAPGRTTRYRLLDAMRRFGHDQLVDGGDERSAGEWDVLVARHLDLALAAARNVARRIRTEPASAAVLLDEHWDEWRIAVSRALELGDASAAARIVCDLWPAMVTARVEHAEWVSAVRERLTDTDPLAVVLCYFDAHWALSLGDSDRAIAVATSGLEPGSPVEPYLWKVIAEAHTTNGDGAAALAAAVESLRGSPGGTDEGLLLGNACRSAWGVEPSMVRPWAERLCAVAAANGRADDRARAAHAMGITSLIDGAPKVALAWFREGRDAARGMRGLEGEALQGIARAAAMIGGDGVDEAFVEALTALHHDRNWKYCWEVVETLAAHWLDHEQVEDGAVLLGHLEAHVRVSSVDVPRRRHAVEVVRADPGLVVFMQRGAAMSGTEVVELALDRLAR